IGKRETLLRPAALGRSEAPLDWPDQGTAERNWALNNILLDRVIAAGGPIRDADACWGLLKSHTGFLARERLQMRAAGLKLGRDGTWSRTQRRRDAMLDLAPVLMAR